MQINSKDTPIANLKGMCVSIMDSIEISDAKYALGKTLLLYKHKAETMLENARRSGVQRAATVIQM